MATKKPSAAQLAARAAFTKMVKERARLRAAGKLPPVKRKAKAAKKRTVRAAPSPAQLAARKKFVAMVRAKAAGKKKTNSRGFSSRPPSWTLAPTKKKAVRRKKRNPGVLKMTEAEFAKLAPKLGLSSPAPVRTRTVSASPRAKRAKKFKKVGIFGGSGFLGLGKSVQKISRNPKRVAGPRMKYWTDKQGRPRRKVVGLPKGASIKTFRSSYRTATKNPKGEHLPGLPAKYQRMYEHVLASSGSKQIAAATVHRCLKRDNPSLLRRLFGARKAKVGYRRTQRGRTTKVAAVGYRKTQRGTKRPTGYMLSRSVKHNPSPAEVFTEFRGKNVTKKTRVPASQAAAGTPSTLAILGTLKELRLRGKTLRFKTGKLTADGRKRLHIVGVKINYRGNPGGEIDAGEILAVTYQADKPHIEEGVYNYVHKFGEEGGTRPHLIIDQEGRPKIEGGSYDITADGIID